MGGYGSGRPATRPAADDSYAWPLGRVVAPALAELRRLRAQGDNAAAVRGVATWSRRGRQVAAASFTIHTRNAEGRPAVLLDYTADGVPVADALDLAELPSNLGRGVVLYWRCPCGQLARVLYLGPAQRWRCRRCVPVVYASSRSSDARVSALLARAAEGVALDLADAGDAPALRDLAALTAGALIGSYRDSVAGLLLAFKALDRLGMGIGQRGAAPRWHGSMGRPRPR